MGFWRPIHVISNMTYAIIIVLGIIAAADQFDKYILHNENLLSYTLAFIAAVAVWVANVSHKRMIK